MHCAVSAVLTAYRVLPSLCITAHLLGAPLCLPPSFPLQPYLSTRLVSLTLSLSTNPSYVPAMLSLFIIPLFTACALIDASGSVSHYFGDLSVDPPASPQCFPGISQAGKGYDVLYGNPHSTQGPDPGFRDQVFSMSHLTASSSDDNRWLVPQGVDAFQDVSCRLDWSTDIVSDMSRYVSTLAASVAVGASSSFYGSFSASLSYQAARSAIQSRQSSLSKTGAECSLYTVIVNEDYPPPFHFDFQRAVANLLNATGSRDELIRSFVEDFGTHVAFRMTLGARFGQQSELSASYVQSQSQQDIKAGAKASAFNAINAEASFLSDIEQGEQFAGNSSSQSLFTMGSVPPKNGDATTWASKGIHDPAPIHMSNMVPLYNLLAPPFWPKSAPLAALQSEVEAFIDSYCDSIPGANCGESTVDDLCFGGFYSVDDYPLPGHYPRPSPNPVTGQRSCPAHYTAQWMLNDSLAWCLADDPALCRASSFGGFYTDRQLQCQDGNPLAQQSCSCPAGFWTGVSSGWAGDNELFTEDESAADSCRVYYCSRVQKNKTVVGGGFSVVTAAILNPDNGYCSNLRASTGNNWIQGLWNVSDCPPGYGAYLMYSWTTHSSGNPQSGPLLEAGDAYICLLLSSTMFAHLSSPMTAPWRQPIAPGYDSCLPPVMTPSVEDAARHMKLVYRGQHDEL